MCFIIACCSVSNSGGYFFYRALCFEVFSFSIHMLTILMLLIMQDWRLLLSSMLFTMELVDFKEL